MEYFSSGDSALNLREEELLVILNSFNHMKTITEQPLSIISNSTEG